MSAIVPRRTALYVPGSNERALAKAPFLHADVLILDLEDAVAPSAKFAARERVAAALPDLAMAGSMEIVIRVNGLDTEWGRGDLAAAIRARPDAILLPKISRSGDIEAARSALLAAGSDPAGVSLWAMIETPRAVLDPLGIAAAKDGPLPLAAFVLGLNDLARETGTRQVAGRAPMLPWMMNVLAAARAAGLVVLDGVYNDITDAAGFAEECAMARDCGFDGKTVIHPSQIEACNAAFSPSAEEVRAAEAVAHAFDAPENQDRGAVMVDGRMVERLHAELARRVLTLAAALEARRDR